MNAFDRLPPDLQTALRRLGIETPTPVQQAALPPLLQGKDVLATAQTGTGKTFAFLLPLIVRLRQAADKTALILSPTRELAQQTQDALISLLADPKEMPSALIIGGDNIHKQYADLRRKPRLVIGTPGRVLDHIGRKSLSLKNTAFFVLDEADRMLDMGFIPDVRKIGSALPAPRQTLLFSATLPREIEALCAGFMTDPVRVQIGSVTRPVDLVLQQFVRLTTRDKLPQLVHELNTRKGSVLVFVKSRHGAERLAKQLKLYGCKAAALHGDLRQSRRRQVMDQFRLGDVPALVATDVAARGIDVADISCVINYDLPQCPEDYIHRIGRTGRAGGTGTALSFVAEDTDKWKDICRVCRLGKLTELTKTDRPLPKPKFTPDAPRKKEKTPRPKETAGKEMPDMPRPVLTEEKRKNAVSSLAKNTLQMSAPERKKKGLGLPKNKSKKSLSSAPAVSSVGETALRAGFRVVRAGGQKKGSSSVLSREGTGKPHGKKHGGKTGKRQAAFSKFFKRKKH